MTHLRSLALPIAGLLVASSLLAQGEDSVPALSSVQAIVSVADQKIVVLRDGGVIAKYPISTSRFGVGDQSGSYKTPLGKLRVYEKLGDNLPQGAVLKHRRATGEVLSVNAPGRDPIVTRILWLDGTESQNQHAKDRAIYIHGTPEEKLIGKPASYGCIRMRSKDVIALYEDLAVGAAISIIPDKLPRLAKYVPPTPKVVAKVTPPAKVEKEDSKTDAAALAKAEAVKEQAKEDEESKASPIPASTAKLALAMAKAASEVRTDEAEEDEPRRSESRKTESRKEEPKLARTLPAEMKSAEGKPAAEIARVEKPAGPRLVINTPAKKVSEAKAEPPADDVDEAPVRVAKAERVLVKPAQPKPTPAAARPQVLVASVSEDGRSATVRKRPLPAPAVVSNPVDPDRLAFIRNHEAKLASSRATPEMLTRSEGSAPAPTVDLSSRMKGSILDAGLTH